MIPCYNSDKYVTKAVLSVLRGGHTDVEILIVDDGSNDRTGEIAEQFALEYSGKVFVFHQPNLGHGGAVNTGIGAARGTYLKVLDSDDWFDAEALDGVMDTLRRMDAATVPLDLLVTNYVYEKVGVRHTKRMRYSNVLPKGRVLVWEDTGSFRYGQYLMMHSLIYRTSVIRESGLKLPEHTFYVDNLFVTVPLPYVKSLCYLDVDLYRYYIGRSEQSVNEAVMIRRIDQQLEINRLILDHLVSAQSEAVSHKVRQALYHHFEIVTSISSILLIKAGDRASLEKKHALWSLFKQKSPLLYRRLRWGIPGILVNLPGPIGRLVSVSIYRFAQRFVGFN